MRPPGGTTGLRAALLLAALFGAAALARIDSCPEPASADRAAAILESDASDDGADPLGGFDAEVTSASLDRPRLFATPALQPTSLEPTRPAFGRPSVSRAPPFGA